MKLSTLSTLSVILFTASAYAGDFPAAVVEGTVMKEGVVYPLYNVGSKSYFRGEWVEPVAEVDRHWRPKSAPQWIAAMESQFAEWGYSG